MTLNRPGDESAARTAAQFVTTHWSVVLAARESQSPLASEALERLCRTYWYPLYAFIRREGYGADDAEDLTQAFFERFLEKHYLKDVQQARGRFRSFLLAALRHFLSDERDKARTLKRGGTAAHLSLDAQEAEERYRMEPVERMDAERIFERRWAMTLLERAVVRLRQECTAAGKAEVFEALKDLVAGENELSCGDIAARLEMKEGAIKSQLHRLRQRYRILVREEIAQTVAAPQDIDEEIRHLIEVIGE